MSSRTKDERSKYSPAMSLEPLPTYLFLLLGPNRLLLHSFLFFWLDDPNWCGRGQPVLCWTGSWLVVRGEVTTVQIGQSRRLSWLDLDVQQPLTALTVNVLEQHADLQQSYFLQRCTCSITRSAAWLITNTREAEWWWAVLIDNQIFPELLSSYASLSTSSLSFTKTHRMGALVCKVYLNSQSRTPDRQP